MSIPPSLSGERGLERDDSEHAEYRSDGDGVWQVHAGEHEAEHDQEADFEPEGLELEPRVAFGHVAVVAVALHRRYSSTVTNAATVLIGPLPAPDVTVAHVRRLVAQLSPQLAPSSVAGVLAVTSGLFRHAVRNGLAERNPVRDLDRDDRPSVRRLSEPRYLTADELARLLDELGDTWRPVAATCAYAGLRISETLGLRWRDVDFEAGTLTVAGQLGRDGSCAPVKTSASEAPAPLLPALARELKAHRSRQASIDLRRVHAEALVFTTSTGRSQSRRNALRAVHAAGDQAELNPEGRERVGLHDLRHSFCGRALDAGATLAEVAALARHADSSVTAKVYAGLADDGRAKAAAKLTAAGFGA